MIRSRLGRSAVAFSFLLCAAGAAPAQEEDSYSHLSPYSEFRARLLAEGWRPDAGFGLKLASGRPLYRFPEVLCGPQICHARWLARAGGERIVKLIRNGLSEEYRVAP